MPTNKLQRFREVAEFDHVLEYSDFQKKSESKPKGKWKSDIFGNENPITLELGCGKGAYTLALARRFPEQNFIGIDIKGARIWKGAKQAKEEGLENVRFLRIYIDHLYEYFADSEVSDIWITFPDPYLKPGDRNKRLTSPKFLKIYQQVLRSEAHIRLKTDSEQLFLFTKQVIEQTQCKLIQHLNNIYQERSNRELLTIKTDFEKKHLREGKTISFIKFCLPEFAITHEMV